MERLQVLLVLGHKLRRDGSMSPAFKDYCERAVRHAFTHPAERTVIVVSGGNTVEGYDTEAEVGTTYIKELLAETALGGVTVECVEEPTARTTPENVSATIEALVKRGLRPSRFVIFGRAPQLARVRAIFWRRRQEIKKKVAVWWKDVVYVAARNDDPLIVDIVEYVLFVPHDFVFPYGRSPLYWTIKILFRNGANIVLIGIVAYGAVEALH